MKRALAMTALLLGACDDPGGGGASALLPDGVVADTTWTETAGAEDAAADSVGDAGADVADSGAPDVAEDTADAAPAPETSGDVGDAGDGPPPVIEGSVVLGEVDSAAFDLAVASARFTAPGDPNPPVETFGACEIRHDDPDSPAAQLRGWDAGTITANGTQPETVTLTPEPTGANGVDYASSLPDDQEDLLPTAGGLITVTGGGGAHLGAFEAVVQAPEMIAITAPNTGFGASVDTNGDLDVSWSTGSGDEVLVTLSPLGDLASSFRPIEGKSMVCTVDGDPGAYTVPAAALQAVLDGQASQNAALGVTRIRRTDKSVDDHTVAIRATRSTGDLVELKD